MTEKNELLPIKPFIRWAGGKQNLVKDLSKSLPLQVSGRYFEPFLGAGSLFFLNNFPISTISDINPYLILTYNYIKDSPEEVSERLEYHRKKISKDYYYHIREIFNGQKNRETIDQAVYFIFLNHTSYNGIFRVNLRGEYNVPFGKPNAAIPSLDHLKRASKSLAYSEIHCCNYQSIINKIKPNDFVYLDPPYPPLNGTSFFQHYTRDKFPLKEQKDLAEIAKSLSQNGVYVMISNAETPLIHELYKNWNKRIVKTYRFITVKAIRQQINELIITNY